MFDHPSPVTRPLPASLVTRPLPASLVQRLTHHFRGALAHVTLRSITRVREESYVNVSSQDAHRRSQQPLERMRCSMRSSIAVSNGLSGRLSVYGRMDGWIAGCAHT
jgi:hypothetical protein